MAAFLLLALAASCASSEPTPSAAGGAAGAGAGAGVGGDISLGGAMGSSSSGDPASACVVDDAYCDWPAETCACAECKGKVDCGLATCVDDHACDAGESCLCADCAFLPKCEGTCDGFGACSSTKSCACLECASLEACQNLDTTCGYWSPEGCACVDDGVCDPYSEPCQCPDCHTPSFGGCPAGCTSADGDCSFHEGCACEDCVGDPRCADAFESCDGAALDGSCAEGESCDCPDCALLGKCVVPLCDGQSACNVLYEWCICPGCWQTPACNDSVTCQADGACHPEEGCHCPDCADAPECLPLSADCEGKAPDGVCAAGEPCSCVDCANTEPCAGCDDNGTCGGFEGCICPDCEGAPPAPQEAVASWQSHCYPYVDEPIPCDGDGVCSPWTEGCGCPDCFGSDWCADNTASCSGGAPDGTCTDADPCGCPDCWWSGKCVVLQCTDDGSCEFDESQLCPDCASTPSRLCDYNGACLDWFESCDCPDCADAPTCSP